MDTLQAAMAAADQALDDAWSTGLGVADALDHAKMLSQRIGREPLIEDAKLLIADAQGCPPSEAFVRLVTASQLQNRKLAELARDLATLADFAGELGDQFAGHRDAKVA